MRLPRHWPATIRTSARARLNRVDVCYASLEAAHSPVFIALESKCDIDRRSPIELGDTMGESPANRFDLSVTSRQAQPHSIASDQLRLSRERDILCDEDGSRITHTEWLEMLEHSLEPVVNAIDCDLEVDLNFRDQILGPEHRRGNFIETLREFLNLVATNRDSGGGLVAAVTHEEIRRPAERLVKVENRIAARHSAA